MDGNEDEAMSTQDETLLRRLREVARTHAQVIPAQSVAAARAAFTWRTVDDELARLGYDSALESAELAGVRGTGPRLLTFEAPGVAIDLELSSGATGAQLQGQATGNVARLEIQRPDGAGNQPVEIDDTGSFRIRDIDPGVIRLRCLLGNGGAARIVSTEWVAI